MAACNHPLDIIGQSVLSDAFVFCPMGAGGASKKRQSTRAFYRPVLLSFFSMPPAGPRE